ncbi:MAG: DUF192 domain-containing protein [Planctomycetes bacterium]|nr:DUF192 domain-containing protein [Planctomycetota bacterium]
MRSPRVVVRRPSLAARIGACFMLAALALPGCGDEPRLMPVTNDPSTSGRVVLDVAGRTVTAELAITPEQTQRGLMERTHLDPDSGMLFLFQTERPRLFWMRNTRIPLDIVFLAGDGTVINVAEAPPLVERPGFASERPARFVLEMARGWCAQAGLRPGDRIDVPVELAEQAVTP